MKTFTLLIGLAIALIASSPMQAGGESKLVGGPHYFGSMAGKSLPERLINPISKAEATRPDREGAYYIAQFDKRGNLVSLEKVLRGAVIGQSRYNYDDRGRLLDGEHSEPDGPTLRYKVDASGKLRRVN